MPDAAATTAVSGGRRRKFVFGPRHRSAVVMAAQLQDALLAHEVRADAHVLASGRIALSVAPGLLVRTDGEHIWWTIQGPGRRTRPRLAMYRTPVLAAEHLAKHLIQQPPGAPEHRDALPQ
ncbi:hypothetical protein [Streptosporangium sp. NPDC006007]|uniref:hypothetical protein n=1 Tax=Streptosporangium sp. NPDC006007 TaxID=3154575 RepID=UPI0033AD3910